MRLRPEGLSLKVCAALAWMAASAWAQNAPKPPVTLAVHLLVACGTPGAGAAVKAAGPEARLCLERKPFLTQDDVQSAEVQQGSQGHPLVFLTFHDDAAIRELQITRKNIGNRVGIVLNGRVVGTPAIRAASRLLWIDGGFTRQQAEAVVAAFERQLAQRQKASGK
jgi:hypothetical protein